ncbi:MAG: hypothetical protein LLG01_12640 [Planctomycetaceae bacterium]|nr:hypothetical protein [Planctomycetaceae bacterium]
MGAQVEGGGEVIVYPAPAGEEASEDFVIEAGGKKVFPYVAKVFDTVHGKEVADPTGYIGHLPWVAKVTFASFDFRGRINVTVRSRRKVASATVRPLSYGIVPEVRGNTISFTLDRPRLLTIEINDSPRQCLHLFANAVEKDVPDPKDPAVRYFGPGVHKVKRIIPRSGETVYIAGGAVVMSDGTPGPLIDVRNAQNVTIRGRGILDGSPLPHCKGQMIAVAGSWGVQVRDVICRDSSCWTVVLDHSRNVQVQNIKEISYRINSDGINTVNSQDVRIEGCFVRNKDDSIVVKTLARNAPAENIAVRGCVIWNDWGYSLGATYEMRSDIRNVLFSNCDVIHSTRANNVMPVLGVFNGDSATVDGVRFENIRIERAANPLLGITIARHPWSKDATLGNIRNVTLSNITAPPHLPPSRIFGSGPSSTVKNVTLENVRIGGRPLCGTDGKKAIKIGNFAENVTLR